MCVNTSAAPQVFGWPAHLLCSYVLWGSTYSKPKQLLRCGMLNAGWHVHKERPASLSGKPPTRQCMATFEQENVAGKIPILNYYFLSGGRWPRCLSQTRTTASSTSTTALPQCGCARRPSAPRPTHKCQPVSQHLTRVLRSNIEHGGSQEKVLVCMRVVRW